MTDGLDAVFISSGEANAIQSLEVVVIQHRCTFDIDRIAPEVLGQQLHHLWLRREREGVVYFFDPVAVHPIDLFVVEIPAIHVPQVNRSHEDQCEQRHGRLELVPGHGGNQARQNHEQSQGPEHIRSEHFESSDQGLLVPQLLHRHVPANGRLEIKEYLGDPIKSYKQNHQSQRTSQPPPSPLLGHSARLCGLSHQFFQAQRGSHGNRHEHQHQHHLGVAEFAKRRHVIEEEIHQHTAVPPAQQDGQQGNDQERPPQPVASGHEEHEEQRYKDGAEVKRPA